MKKYIYTITIALLLLIISLTVSSCIDKSQIGTNSSALHNALPIEPTSVPAAPTDRETEAVFTDGVHKRNDAYGAMFNTKYIHTGSLTLNIEARIFNEDTADSLLDKIRGDCSSIEVRLNAQTDNITVYIVDTTITYGIFVSENIIYCTVDDVLSGRYRQDLIFAYFNGVTAPWQNTGAAEYIWGEIPDIQPLKNYYGDDEHMNTLTLFAAYFCDAFVDEETLEIAKNTAVSLTEFTLGEYGIDAFLSSSDSAEYRQKWLKYIGIDSEYTSPFDLRYIEGAT